MAGRPHSYHLPVVGFAVKKGMNRNPAFSKHAFHIKRYFNIGGVHIGFLSNHRVKLIGRIHYKPSLYKLCFHYYIVYTKPGLAIHLILHKANKTASC